MEQELAQAIELVSAQLGIAAEKIFGIFVGAQPIIGIISIISMLVVIMGAYIVGKKVHKIMAKDLDGDSSQDDVNAAIWIPVAAFLTTALVIGMILGSVETAVLKIACPEYTAMKEIFELVIR